MLKIQMLEQIVSHDTEDEVQAGPHNLEGPKVESPTNGFVIIP